MRALKLFLMFFILIGLLTYICANVLITYSESDYTNGTDNNTLSTDSNVTLAIASGNNYFPSGYYLSQIFDLGAPTDVYSFFWHEDYNYGMPLPDNQGYDNDINMSGNIALFHLDENLDDLSITCDKDILFSDNDMEYSSTSFWTSVNSATLSKETSGVYDGSRSLKIVRTSSSTGGADLPNTVEPYRYYDVSAYAKSDGVGSIRFALGGALIANAWTNTDWQLKSWDHVASSSGTSIRPVTVALSGTPWTMWDNISLSTTLYNNCVQDTSGNEKYGQLEKYSATLGSAFQTSNCKIGGCLAFDALNDYASFSDNDNFSFTDGADNDVPFTIEGWLYPNPVEEYGPIERYIVSRCQSGYYEYRFSNASDNKLNMIMYNQNSLTAYITKHGTITLSPNTWYHVAVTYDGSESDTGIKLYVNGVYDSTATTNSTGTYTGMDNVAGSLYFGMYSNVTTNGLLDQFRVWKGTALSASDINAIYETERNGSVYNVNRSNLVLEVPFDDSPGYTIDNNGLSPDGTLGSTYSRPTSVDGKFGNAYYFNGKDTRVKLGKLLELSSNLTEFSFSTWIYPLDLTSGRRIMSKYYGSSTAAGSLQLDLASNNAIRFMTYNPSSSLETITSENNALETNKWQLITLTYNAGEVNLYVNGILNKTGNLATSYIKPYNYDFYLGEDATISSGQTFNGYMDEVAFWNRELSQVEITNIYYNQVSDLNVQFRSCNDSGCDGESFLGPDNTSDSYYSIGNTTYNLSLETNRYFQYKTIFETQQVDSTKAPSPKIDGVEFQYYSTGMTLDINDIAGYPDSSSLPDFSYVRDSNNGKIRIGFIVLDPAAEYLLLDVNYSEEQISGTGQEIISDLNLDLNYCEDIDFSDETYCYYDWNIYNVPDGNYYLIIKLYDGYSDGVDISENSLYIDNSVPTLNYNSDLGIFDGNVILSCSDTMLGCYKYYYQLDSDPSDNNLNGAWIDVNGDINSLIEYYSDGNYQINYYGEDYYGNTSEIETNYFILNSPVLNTKTYFNNRLTNYFGYNYDLNIVAEFETQYNSHTISFIDSNGYETDNYNLDYFDDNSFSKIITLDYNFEYGWIDANIDGYIIENVFYYSKIWQNDHLSYEGDIYPFMQQINVSNSQSFERLNSILQLDANFEYRCKESSIRILKCADNNCNNTIDNILEVPSQVFDINYSGDYVSNASILFFDSLNNNSDSNYLLVYSIRDINTNYSSDLNSYLNDYLYFENSNYITSLNLNASGFLNVISQKTLFGNYNYAYSDPTLNVVLQKGVYYDIFSGVEDSISFMDINGSLFKDYIIEGQSNIYDINYDLKYTFYANLPYFRLDVNVNPELSLSSTKYTDFYFEVLSNEFTKFNWYDNNLHGVDILENVNGSDIVDENMNYFGFSDINKNLGFGVIFIGAPRQFNKTSFYDDLEYDYISREYFSGNIVPDDDFTSTYYFVFFNSQDMSDLNRIYFDLNNPLEYNFDITTTFDNSYPIIKDINYYPVIITDQNEVVLTIDVNDDLELYNVTLNILGPDTNLIYSEYLDVLDYNFTYDFNVNAGDYNCIVYVSDVVDNEVIDYVTFTVEDHTPAEILEYSISLDNNNDLDPSQTLSFYTTLYEYSGLNDVNGVRVYLEFYDVNNVLEWSEVDNMICDEPNYLTNFYITCSLDLNLDEFEHIIKYQIIVSDEYNNDSNTNLETIYDLWEYSWQEEHDFGNQVSGVLDENISVGNIYLTNTGDKILYLKLSSNWDIKSEIYYNGVEEDTGYNLTIIPGDIATISIVVNAKSTELDISTIFNIDQNDIEYGSNYNPEQETISIIISSVNAGPHAYLEFIDKDISLKQGDTNVHYSAYVKNDGNESCNSAYLSWDFPSGVTIIDSIDRNDFVFISGNYFTDSVYVNVGSSAPMGDKNILLSAGCRDTNYLRTISLDVTVSNAQGGNGNNGGNNSGNGGSGSNSSIIEYSQKYDENNLFNYEQRSKLFETTDQFEIVRGKDNSFIIRVSNPFEDVNLIDISITTTGIFTKYLEINPKKIPLLLPKESRDVVINITAPTYFEEGINNLEFIISGNISGNAIERDLNVKYINFIEKRSVILKIFDVDPKDANIYLFDAQNSILDLENNGFYVGKLKNKLELAKLEFGNEKYSVVKQIVSEILSAKDIAAYVKNKLDELNAKVLDAKQKQILVSETEKLLLFAASALDRGDFTAAKTLIDQAEMTFAFETKGEINFKYIFTKYWLVLLIGALGLLVILSFVWAFARRYRLKLKINHYKNEEKILLFLIRDIQAKCFKENKISIDDYRNVMSSYEERYNKILEEQIKLNYSLKYFKKTEKSLTEEKHELTNMLEKLQKSYFYDNAVESKTYYIKFKSITERIGEIEADLADKEFKKELKKYRYVGDKL